MNERVRLTIPNYFLYFFVVLSRPLPPNEIRTIIFNICGEDSCNAVLTQVLIMFYVIRHIQQLLRPIGQKRQNKTTMTSFFFLFSTKFKPTSFNKTPHFFIFSNKTGVASVSRHVYQN